MTASRILLWRHGETSWNAEHRIQGHADAPLSPLGVEQARAAAVRLAALSPDVLVSSDLGRAVATADALAAVTGLAVRLDPRLRERAYGEWQGLTGDEVAAGWPEECVRWRAGEAVSVAGVEHLDDLAKRVSAALTDLVAAHPGRTVVVTTHGGAARRGVAAVLDWPAPVRRTLGDLRNCHWAELRHQADRGWRLQAYNVS